MTGTLTLDGSLGLEFAELLQDLREYVTRLQRPRLKDTTWRDTVSVYGAELQVRLETMKARLSEAQGQLKTSMDGMTRALDAYLDQLKADASRRQVKRAFKPLGVRYEEMLETARRYRLVAKVRQAHLKPTNYVRNAFHILSGLTGVVLYHLWITWGEAMAVLLSIAAIFLTLEVTRRLSKRWNDFLVDRAFGLFARPFERNHINGSSYFLLALILCVGLLPKPAVEAGVLVLACADPLATLVGKRFGRRKIWRDKSYVGSLTFLVVALASLGVLAALTWPAWPLWRVAGSVVALALAGTLTEMFSTHLDDNFTIPVCCSLVATLLMVW